MKGIIKIFSKFTEEIIFVEILSLSVCLFFYAIWFFLKRARHGIIEEDISSSLVKKNLKELIQSASELYRTLFGNLHLTLTQSATTSKIEPPSQSFDAEKAQLVLQVQKYQKEIQELKQNISLNTPEIGSNMDEVNELKEQVQSLQDRLSEYSIIEDDLAHLKTILHENKRLKEQLKKYLSPTPEDEAKNSEQNSS